MHTLLEDIIQDDVGKEYLKIASTSTSLMLSLVYDILDFSQIRAGKFRLNKERFDIRSAVEKTSSLIMYQASQKGIIVSCTFNPNIYPFIINDEQRFKQVLLNLLGNAIKFTNEGFIKIHVDPLEIGGK
jgi:signal transduction histidine kinase